MVIPPTRKKQPVEPGWNSDTHSQTWPGPGLILLTGKQRIRAVIFSASDSYPARFSNHSTPGPEQPRQTVLHH